MSGIQHLVSIPASIEAANRLRKYADQLSTTMADALEVILQHYDESVGIEGEEDESGFTAVHVMEGDLNIGEVHSISGGSAEGVAGLIKAFPGEFRAFYRTSRGVDLPVGMKLEARYRGMDFEAKVIEGGIQLDEDVFPDPSAAAVAVKRGFGLSPASAQTNGWTFWDYRVGPLIYSLNDFRVNHELAVSSYFEALKIYADWQPPHRDPRDPREID